MKRFLICLMVVMGAVPCFAGDKFPAEVDPGFKLDPVETSTAKLPPALRQRLIDNPDGFFNGPDGKLVKKVDVLECDLNADQETDYLVWDPNFYTGGSVVYLFGSESSGFESLGSTQENFYFAKPVNDYFQIVSTARAGAESYERRLLVYEGNGKGYVEKRVAAFRFDENDTLIFVKDLSVDEN